MPISNCAWKLSGEQKLAAYIKIISESSTFFIFTFEFTTYTVKDIYMRTKIYYGEN